MASVTSLGVHEPAGLRFAVAEGLLPPNPSPELYDWKIFSDENGEDELLTTENCAIWSRGGEVGRCLRFDIEKEPISTALLAYFPTSEDDVQNAGQSSTSNSAPTPTPTPKSSPQNKREPPPLAKSLVVFLKTQAHVYSFSGGDHVLHMPFEVDSAIAGPCGVIIQRKSKVDTTVPVTLKFPRAPPNSFVSSQILPPSSLASMTNNNNNNTAAAASSQTFSTAALGKPKPLPLRLSSTLETMWDTPLEASSDSGWPRLVCLTDPMSEIGLVVTQPDKSSKDRYPKNSNTSRTPFLDPAEEILHIETIRQGSKPLGATNNDGNPRDNLILAVTVNRETSMYSVWRMTYLSGEDQFTRRRKAPKTKAGTAHSNNNRRRSSVAPGLASGATTPHHASFRESIGAPMPMKRTRKSERLEMGADTATLEKALSIEANRAAEVSRRQSRRVSSLLARADLSASHERPLFTEQPAAPPTGGRRVDSHGSQRGRLSSGYGLGANLQFNQTLNSLHEADGVLEELRLGGDFEGFHNMGLDDPEFDGLSKEILFLKIHSMSMDTTNLRYSMSNKPATKLCKVFIIVGTPYSVDEQDRNYLLVCIQDAIDKRLQLLTLHIQMRDDHGSSNSTPSAAATSITWGQHRRAQNVADSCMIYDGDQAMIFILSEGEQGHRQLSIQAPWSELTTIAIPPLSLHNRNLYASPGMGDTADSIFQKAKAGTFGVSIGGLSRPRGKGVVDVIDDKGQSYQVQIQLEPRSSRVRQILNCLRSILPASHAEKMVLGWWQVMQWLATQPNVPSKNREWTALVTELCVIFLAALYPGRQTSTSSLTTISGNRRAPSASAGGQAWAKSKAWNWISDGAGLSIGSGHSDATSGANGSLAEPIRLAEAFMASEAGVQAVGQAGYLPTALSVSETARKKAVWGITMALHLLLEEDKLDIMAAKSGSSASTDLKAVVHRMCLWLNWPTFAAWYALELPGIPTHQGSNSTPALGIPEPESIPNILDWVRLRLIGTNSDSFPCLRDIFAVLSQQNHKDVTRGDAVWKEITPRTLMFRRFFDETKPTDSSARVVEAMYKCGFTLPILDSLPEGMATPFQDAITRCQQRPPSHWTKELYELVGRGDMNTVLKNDSQAALGVNSLLALHKVPPNYNSQDIDDAKEDMAIQAAEEPESEERQVVIQALFREDKRLIEAQNLLSSSKPRVVRLNPKPEWSEPEYLERQKELVTTIATSTLATSAGRGMLNYGFRFPLLTQKFNVQGFNLTCIVKPNNVAVGVDKAMFTEEKVNWAFFHQGVAYGLAISARAKGIDTSWIVFNRPGTDLSHRHAGFLLALGLNGHLKSVAKWVAFKYLTPKHMMTSIGLLLGLAVSHLGTMDSLITRLLSVHVTRMLPRGAAELNLSHQIQTTGIMGIGLLYYNSQHRRMSEIMMSEIEYMEDEDEEDPLRNEGYRLAAAFALGFINLGRGNDRKGLLDMQITEQLLSLASSTKKVELVNVLDRSAAAATVAIALIYMKSEDHIVARKIDIPDSVLQFDYVRPDILLLRTLAKNLILWSKIEATFDWVRRSLPAEYRNMYLLTHVEKLNSLDLPLFSIVAGLCFASALRFAGSGNVLVRDVLVYYLDRFRKIVQDLPAETFDAQIARSGARMCLDVLALSSATVMAGTGDLVVLRRLRALHGGDDAHTTYGSHLAAHLAIGTLFLGSGTTTFGNSNLAVAALLVAFYPIFPKSIQDNGSHLQAFRHFWVLATEPRCLVTKDMATDQPISVPILIYLRPSALSLNRPSTTGAPSTAPPNETVLRRQTPCLLPPLDDILTIRTDASAQGFWDLEVGFEKDPSLKAAFQANQNLYLRRRPAHQNAFSTTLQALASSSLSSASTTKSRNLFSALSSQGISDPVEWVLNLDLFKGLSRAERALLLGSATAESTKNESGGTSGGAVSGTRALSSTIDARLALEGSLSGTAAWGRDALLDLRLLFDWADQREHLRAKDVVTEKTENGDDGRLPPWNNTSTDWWMSDRAVDMLKGKVWLIAQDEE
ncbi:Anaphase-promoting complex subunit 1 [Sporothrix stenoceras]|uniref:Anaphase-promoting complex subunit 1 n=1 Tax=Sporothrix stenoceras TaxID=5173 RepID=A0ABR3YWF9_9PEZI